MQVSEHHHFLRETSERRLFDSALMYALLRLINANFQSKATMKYCYTAPHRHISLVFRPTVPSKYRTYRTAYTCYSCHLLKSLLVNEVTAK